MDIETDLACKQTARALHSQAAQNVVRKRLFEEKTPSLTADEVRVVGEHAKRIQHIDKELKIKGPTALVYRRLQWEEEALQERKKFMKEFLPVLKHIAHGEKHLTKSGKYRKFSKYADRFFRALEKDNTGELLVLADDIVNHPFTYSEDLIDKPDGGVLTEIVTSALGKESHSLGKKLAEAIQSGTGVDDIVEHIPFPEISHSPISKTK